MKRVWFRLIVLTAREFYDGILENSAREFQKCSINCCCRRIFSHKLKWRLNLYSTMCVRAHLWTQDRRLDKRDWRCMDIFKEIVPGEFHSQKLFAGRRRRLRHKAATLPGSRRARRIAAAAGDCGPALVLSTTSPRGFLGFVRVANFTNVSSK